MLKQSGKDSRLMIECKNNESYDGILQACDTFMNMRLTDVTITSPDGKFTKCGEVFIRGNNIKGIQFEPEVLEKHQVIVKQRQA